MPSRLRSPLKEINSNAMPIVCILILVGLLVYVLLRWNKSTESFATAKTSSSPMQKVVFENKSNLKVTVNTRDPTDKTYEKGSLTLGKNTSGSVNCTKNCIITITSTKNKGKIITKNYSEILNNKMTFSGSEF